MPEKTTITNTKKSFKANYKNLEKLSLFVGKTAQQVGFDEEKIYRIRLAVDEACSNIIEHGYGGVTNNVITCICSYAKGELTIQLLDTGKIFDPKLINEPDLNADLEKRPLGGLGVFFIRQLMDEVNFTFANTLDASPETSFNVLTMVIRKG